MPLSFQPLCLPIVRSGLPHTSPSLALGLLMTTLPSILTWPRLPKRTFHEQWFVQGISGFPGLVIDSLTGHVYVDRTAAERDIDTISLAYLQKDDAIGEMTQDHASGLADLLRIPKDWFQGIAIESHLVGPISMGLQMTDEQQRSILYDPMLLDALAHFLSLRSSWLSGQLAHFTQDTIICLDEPFLDAFNSPFFPIDWDRGTELLEIVFDGIKGCRGIATGSIGKWPKEQISPVYWAPLLDTSVEFILFDVYYHSQTLLRGADVIPGFLNRPGFIGWGIVPSHEDGLSVETVDTLVVRFQRLLHTLEAATGIARHRILQASFISTSGNLDHLTPMVAEYALQLCAKLSLHIRSIYGLE